MHLWGRGAHISVPFSPQDGRGVSRAKSGNQEVEYHAQNREIKSAIECLLGCGIIAYAVAKFLFG